MKYTIEITDTQQRIMDAFDSVLDYCHVDYLFSPNKDRTGIDFSHVKMKYSYSSHAFVDFYLEDNEIALSSYKSEIKGTVEICDEFRAKESALVAVAKALDPTVKIVRRVADFQDSQTVERL